MINITYNNLDKRYIFLKSDKEQEIRELEKYLNKIPQYQFLPSFRGIPKAVVFLNRFKYKDQSNIYWCHGGLWQEIYMWSKDHNISIEGIDDNYKYINEKLTYQDFEQYIERWKLNITPYDYQVKAAWKILKYRQSLSELATRSGKTLIAYMVFRYMLEHGAHNILMIVPSIQLVKQGVEDLKEYQEFFKSETIWAKGEYCESSNLTIGTYQSLVKKADKTSKKYDPHFFDKFDVICIDEAHHLVAKSINTILSLNFIKNAKIRFGFTGTLPQKGTIESFTCQSLMGPKIQDINTMELVDKGILAKPIITQIRINYDYDEELKDRYIKCGEYLNSIYKMEQGKKKILPSSQQEFTIKYDKSLPYVLKNLKDKYTKEEYIDYLIDLCKSKGSNLLMLEQMLVHRMSKRLKVMNDIILGQKGNCIVFAHHTEYLKYLKNHFEESFPNKKVCLITGKENLKKRTAILNLMLQNNDVILCASYGCCSTGITFKNINYAIFGQSFKSEIIVLQSIGRGLLKTEGKDDFYIYDIIDVFPSCKIYNQGIKKIKTYKDKNFKFFIKKE